MRVRILSGSLTAAGESLRGQPSPGGLIFGLIRMRSPTFISVRINAAMQVADVNVTRRTIIPTSEKRKVGGSTALLVAPLASVNAVVLLSVIARRPDMIVGPSPVI